MKYGKIKTCAILTLLSILLASCAAEPGGEPSATSAAQSDAGAAEATTAASEYKRPDADYKGADFTFLDYDTEEYFWQAASYSDVRAEAENGDTLNDAQYKRNMKVEDELNVSLKTHPVESGSGRNANADEMQKLVLAGEQILDASFIFGNEIKKLVSMNDLVIDLYDIPTLDLSRSWWDQGCVEELTVNDSLRYVTGDISIYTQFSPILYFFNKTVAENYKLPDMYGLVREGKWIYDTVFEFCKTVSNDADGDGVMGEKDNYGMAIQRGLATDMLISGGFRFAKAGKDGKIQLLLNTANTADMVEKAVTHLNNKNVCCDANAYSSKYSNPFHGLHIPMFKNHQLLFNFNQLLIAYELRAMEADYGILPTPKYDEKQDAYHTCLSLSWMTMLCVPATNTRYEMTGHVLDAMGYYSQQYVTPAFIDTNVRVKALRDEDSAEMLDIVLGNRVLDVGQIYNWGNMYSFINTMSSNNNTNFASEYAKIEPAVLTAIDTYLESIK